MADQKVLDGYGGQTTEELLALASEYRIDLVLAFEGPAAQAEIDDLAEETSCWRWRHSSAK